MIPQHKQTQDTPNQSVSVSRPEHLPRPHPGHVFKRRCLSKTTMKQPEVASMMGITAKHLSRFINGHVSVTTELARKLESVTNISARAWMNYQIAYDLYKTPKRKQQQSILVSLK